MSNSEGSLPNLIIIGAQKGGTTSLHYYLGLHPEICMSAEKELNFFIPSKNGWRGLEWYKQNFRGDAKIRGESSPAYTGYPMEKGIAERMAQQLPAAKLIYILRDPIERIRSQYIHMYAANKENRSLEHALGDLSNNQYVFRSLYFMQLEQFLVYYPASQIFITTTEELYADRARVLRQIFHFLEVDERFDSPHFRALFHRSHWKRRKTDVGLAIEQRIGSRIEARLPPALRGQFKFLFYLPFSQPIANPPISPELRARLTAVLKPDIDRLRAFTGRSFENWSL